MRLILKDYLRSLKERDQLDVLVQYLLSQMGFNVFSTPRRGVKENGVDIAAYGQWPGDDEEKVYLFAIKSGDISRANWTSHTQSLRYTIEEILDSYIPHMLLPEYKAKKIVICPCFGGTIDKTVHLNYCGFIEGIKKKHPEIQLQTINGDALADLCLEYLCNEKLFLKPVQRNFEKALAYINDADICFRHFKLSTTSLFNSEDKLPDQIRLIYLMVHVLFINARQEKCLLSIAKCSELALLSCWEQIRKRLQSKKDEIYFELFTKLVMLNCFILETLIAQIKPYSETPFALSCAVRGDSGILNYGCISIRLSEILGFAGSLGHWLLWIKQSLGSVENEENKNWIDSIISAINTLNLFIDNTIHNNPICYTPIQDEQCSDLLILFDYWIRTNQFDTLNQYLEKWTQMSFFSLSKRRYYTSNTRGIKAFFQLEYKNRKEFTDQDFQKSTNSLATIAYVSLLAKAFHLQNISLRLDQILDRFLSHSSLQIYLFDEVTEENLYSYKELHGVVLSDISFQSGNDELVKALEKESKLQWGIFKSLSCVRYGFIPLVYTACRHYKLPIPGTLLYGLSVQKALGKSA